ncbi:MAG: tetratricopeptide repeat protein [Gammaproteobacteria bacterium]|nr:tetratricopeptide repeat protein [Gammaproteobacteria bacterium]
MTVPSRNDSCPCGSGRKYKKCCMDKARVAFAPAEGGAARLVESAAEHRRQGRLAQAEVACRQALAADPERPDALHLLGQLAAEAGQHRLAAELIERAVSRNGSNAGYYNDLGLAYGAMNRLDRAAASYQHALALQPDHFGAQVNLACACAALGRQDEAAEGFRKALVLRPDSEVAHFNLGNTCYTLGRFDDAVASYRAALALKPDYHEVYVNLANAYIDQGKPEEAAACCRQAIALNPGSAIAHYNLGLACFNQGKLDDAAASYTEALARKPDYVGALVNLGLVYINLGRLEDAAACYRKALQIKPDSALAHSTLLFTMLFQPSFSPQAIFEEHHRFAQRCELPLKPRWRPHGNSRDPDRRLKVGYVSADFRRHSVAHFIEPILACHDKTQVEVYCYYNHTRYDDVTRRIAACADHWTPCKGLSDEQLAERVRADGIDILVDLAGHTMDNRLLTFARKPAPVQVTYLGYPATTGLTAMDYRLTACEVDPPGQESWHSEALYRLPRSLWCYRPPADRPKPAGRPPSARFGAVTFGSLNAFAKISAETLAVWGDILHETPGSRLLMTSVPEGSMRQSLQERFAARGIEPQRLILRGRVPGDQYLELLGQVDIALDPFPYNGTTTTCETLWMGIPVVTLTGISSVSRSGHALLKSVGLGELAAADTRAYVEIATGLAVDQDRLAGLRSGLRQWMMASALRDETGITRDLEAAYRTMWYTWCTSKSDHISGA